MSNEEKILLIKLILEDIRGNWGWENGNRGVEAYELSRELYKSTNDEKWDKLSECIARYEHGEDGRYFLSLWYDWIGKIRRSFGRCN